MFHKARKIHRTVALQTGRLKGKPKGQMEIYEIWPESLPGKKDFGIALKISWAEGRYLLE